MATKVFKNRGDAALNILGVGELQPGEQISLSGNYLPVVILENYPGLADITDEEVEDEENREAALDAKENLGSLEDSENE